MSVIELSNTESWQNANNKLSTCCKYFSSQVKRQQREFLLYKSGGIKRNEVIFVWIKIKLAAFSSSYNAFSFYLKWGKKAKMNGEKIKRLAMTAERKRRKSILIKIFASVE